MSRYVQARKSRPAFKPSCWFLKRDGDDTALMVPEEDFPKLALLLGPTVPVDARPGTRTYQPKATHWNQIRCLGFEIMQLRGEL
ncbi:MAG: hypothetical protein ACYSWO_26600 [Planctomycetota bacterium]|jgi:hypothetical protein